MYLCNRFIDDQLHQVETVGSDARRGMFGALHVLRAEPTYATALTETDGVAYTLESKELNKVSYMCTLYTVYLNSNSLRLSAWWKQETQEVVDVLCNVSMLR
jgi:hypothetical protein